MGNTFDKKDRLNMAYRYLLGIGAVSKRQELANKMGYNKSSISRAFTGNDNYLTNAFLAPAKQHRQDSHHRNTKPKQLAILVYAFQYKRKDGGAKLVSPSFFVFLSIKL